MSDLNATFVLTATANSLSCNVAHININRSSIKRHRAPKCCGACFPATIRSDFTADVPLIVHWDGELLEELTSKQHVDWLLILIPGNEVSKLLVCRSLWEGQGKMLLKRSLLSWQTGVLQNVSKRCALIGQQQIQAAE